MFPAFENAQQQQQQQSSSFSQTAMNDSKLPAFGQFAPLSGNSMADAFKPASNPFGGFSSNNFAAPNMTTSQTGFGFASSLSTSASSFPGLQTLAFPQFTSPSNPPALSGHDAGREPPESVFAEFVRPAAMKPSEPVPSASAPSRSYCTFFQKGPVGMEKAALFCMKFRRLLMLMGHQSLSLGQILSLGRKQLQITRLDLKAI
ncbi:hypothetical protein BVRB_024580, partial [Beta vulgaris subsp. vulgaris]